MHSTATKFKGRRFSKPTLRRPPPIDVNVSRSKPDMLRAARHGTAAGFAVQGGMMSNPVNRRAFLSQLGASGALLAAGPWLRSIGYAQIARRARARGDAAITNACRLRSSRLFGAFLEHLGRAIYTGVYEPGSRPRRRRTDSAPTSSGEIKELGVPVMRYPGGNFVSGYNWLDGVGPKKQRPTVLERAWNSLETNQFGTNEFIDWCKLVGTEPLLAFNLGTGTPEMAVAYVEYCNVDKGTKWSELRRSHGYERRTTCAYWCLGNEMDGPWQMGHMPAREYGRKARDAARQIRVIDREPATDRLRLEQSESCRRTWSGTARSSKSATTRWTRISLHNYYGNTPAADGQQQRAIPRDEPGHGAADSRDRRRLRLRAGAAEIAETAVAVVRRVERLVSRARRRRSPTASARSRRSCSRRSTTSRTRCWSAASSTRCCGSPTACASVPRPDSQRHRAAGDQRNVRAAAEHLLPVRLGLEVRARHASWICWSNRRRTRSRAAGLRADFARDDQVPVRRRRRHDRSARAGSVCVLMLNRDLESERELVARLAGPDARHACWRARRLTGPDLKAFNTFERRHEWLRERSSRRRRGHG